MSKRYFFNVIEEMIQNMSKIDYDKINEYESRFKHDIMAHIYAFGDLCPKAKSFLHLGATSNFINDNVDMIIIKESLTVINELLFKLFQILKEKSLKPTNCDSLFSNITHSNSPFISFTFRFTDFQLLHYLEGYFKDIYPKKKRSQSSNYSPQRSNIINYYSFSQRSKENIAIVKFYT